MMGIVKKNAKSKTLSEVQNVRGEFRGVPLMDDDNVSVFQLRFQKWIEIGSKNSNVQIGKSSFEFAQRTFCPLLLQKVHE
jgi:hypothetical protein